MHYEIETGSFMNCAISLQNICLQLVYSYYMPYHGFSCMHRPASASDRGTSGVDGVATILLPYAGKLMGQDGGGVCFTTQQGQRGAAATPSQGITFFRVE